MPALNACLRHGFALLVMTASLCVQARTDLSITFDPSHAIDPSLPAIAGPVDFNVILIDESMVEFSWNPELLDGSEVDYFRIWDRNRLLAQTRDDSWQLGGIDRNDTYDFSVSAVTVSGQETRRSNRVYHDLPPLDPTLPDAGNHYLPPLEYLRAEVIDADSVRLTWDAAKTFWSGVDPSEYSYHVTRGGSLIDVVDGTSYTYTGLAGQGLVWIGVDAVVQQRLLSSRQSNLILVDTGNLAGTISYGYPGFNSLFGLRADVYSSTAAEVFWDRSDVVPVRYQVYLDGEFLREIDGTSQFFDGLPIDSDHAVAISVVGANGMETDVREVSFRTYSDSASFHEYCRIEGLRASVYSSTAVEVFWDRRPAVASYELVLDGEFLVDTDAVSWFREGFAPGSGHSLSVRVADDRCSDQKYTVQFQLGSPGN